MLKVSFSINNIQSTLQRDYRRAQTILPLEQNVSVDSDEVFRENQQNNYKRQYGSNCIVL